MRPVTHPFLYLLTAAITAASCAANDAALRFTCCSERELVYVNGQIRLSGVLLSPKEPGTYPGAVVLQGAGDSDRTNHWARHVAETFVGLGVAVLLTDKRGVGGSGGDWRLATFADLADDALAGVAKLRTVDGIDVTNIGLIGLSQGGHIAPLAAARGDVQFVVNFVGGTVLMKDALFHELEQTYRQHGLSETDIDFLQELTRRSFHYIESGSGFDEYLAYRDLVTERFGTVATDSWPDDEGDWYWTFWRAIHDFDAIRHWKTVVDEREIPSFIAYGEDDELDNVPVKASVRLLRQSISGDALELHVYPGTGHSLLDAETGQLLDALVDDLDHWLAASFWKTE